MKDIIEDRLNRVKDLNERKILKDVLLNVYQSMVDYNLEMYSELERKIYEDIEDDANKFYIYSTLEYIDNIDPIDGFLYPMVEEDLEKNIYDMDKIREKIKLGKDIIITSVFMQCTNLELQKILQEDNIYEGIIKTNKDFYIVKVKIRKCNKYLDMIKKLYKIFQLNGKPWTTLNCIYAYKFIDIILSTTLNFEIDEEILEVSFDLGKYDKYKIDNVIPLWNIKYINVQDNSFPVPAMDRINFEHGILLNELGEQNGYMLSEASNNIIYVKQYKKKLVIISSFSDQKYWKLIQIKSVENNTKKFFSYELVSNKRDLGFIGRYVNTRSIVVRTKGELAKIISSYEVSLNISFIDVDIISKYDSVEQTLNYNYFIDDNIRVDKYKKIMLLKFQAINNKDYLIQDKISFLVSEVQLLFPEYKCIGELL